MINDNTAEKTTAWQQYERGVDYKTRINLYKTVDLNERFYSGDQWVGIPHEGLPTPVVNFIKYASAWKIAAASDRRINMAIYPEGDITDAAISSYADQISQYCGILWERLKMDYLTKEGLKQAAITGDYIQYFYWDASIKTGQDVEGDIATQLIDNVNYYPGNPNNPDVQSQPYIILIFREMVEKVRAEAKANNVASGLIELITPDTDNQYTAGDRGKVELDDNDKCNVLLKMIKRDEKIYCEKSTRAVVVQPEKDTKLTRYPIALMNWDTRKNCCHGEAEVTYLIPNQVYVNKILALSQLSQMQMSFPKALYDRTRIKQWTNKVAGAIPVNGDITNAVQYLTPPATSFDAFRGLDVTLDKTMRMMGANEVTLGSLKTPDNTSAFIAAREAAMVPLQSIQERFYALVEDIGQIWIDFIRNFYRAGRKIPVDQNGRRQYVKIPENVMDAYEWKLKIEPGPSTTWGETQSLQLLNDLMVAGKITLKQFVERVPNGRIPKAKELIDEITRMEQQAAQPPQPESAGSNPQPEVDPRVVQILQTLAEGIQTGDVKKEAATAIAEAAQQGVGFDQIMQLITEAANRGMISKEFLQRNAA